MSSPGKQLIRSRSGLRMVPQAPSPLSLEEPLWQSDRDSLACGLCGARFDLTNRRHHCRRCGVCACATCCQRMLPLPRMGFVDPVRHCVAGGCAAATEAEAAFYGRQLRLLTAGCVFDFCSPVAPAEAAAAGQGAEASASAAASGASLLSVICCLSADQRLLQFDCKTGPRPDPITLVSVESCAVLNLVDNDASSLPCGVRIRYRNFAGELADLQLDSRRHEAGRRQTMAWIAALQTALRLVADYKRRTRLECSVD